jgi:hypothetical protein
VARPLESKPKTLRNMLDDNDSQQVEVISRQKPYKRPQSSKKKTKKMSLDSDESEQEWEGTES